MNCDFDSFVNIAEVNMNKVQTLFDEYQKEFFPIRSPQFFCLELNGEAGELANAEKKLWKGRQIEAGQLADECADVMIALMNYANSRSINIGEAVRTKLKIIEARRDALYREGKDY